MTDPTSRQRGRPTWTKHKMSTSNKYLVMSSRWGSTPRRTDRLTVGRNVTLKPSQSALSQSTRATNTAVEDPCLVKTQKTLCAL
jgi:hypothetical protein